MPRLKSELFDSIKLAGDIGITTEELWVMHYSNAKRSAAPTTIKSHVNQINDLLVETDYAIRPDGRGKSARWKLVREG
jgi:hypothetical protein